MNEEKIKIRKEIQGKRIAGIDFGMKRVGVAVCDELHITVSPRVVLDYSSNKFWDEIAESLVRDNIQAVVIGVPYRLDNRITEVIEAIGNFINIFKEKICLPVYEYDEAYSSRDAVETMIEIGKKKKKRRQKGNTDIIAASIILRDFLSEIDN